MEDMIESKDNIVNLELKLSPSEMVYNIIKNHDPIKNRGITRKARFLNAGQLHTILHQLCIENKVHAYKNGKAIMFCISSERPQTSYPMWRV